VVTRRARSVPSTGASLGAVNSRPATPCPRARSAPARSACCPRETTPARLRRRRARPRRAPPTSSTRRGRRSGTRNRDPARPGRGEEGAYAVTACRVRAERAADRRALARDGTSVARWQAEDPEKGRASPPSPLTPDSHRRGCGWLGPGHPGATGTTRRSDQARAGRQSRRRGSSPGGAQSALHRSKGRKPRTPDQPGPDDLHLGDRELTSSADHVGRRDPLLIPPGSTNEIRRVGLGKRQPEDGGEQARSVSVGCETRTAT